jgi:hypothetical protein
MMPPSDHQGCFAGASGPSRALTHTRELPAPQRPSYGLSDPSQPPLANCSSGASPSIVIPGHEVILQFMEVRRPITAVTSVLATRQTDSNGERIKAREAMA